MKLQAFYSQHLYVSSLFICLLATWLLACNSKSHHGHDNRQSLALVGAKIYPSPTATPVQDGIVLISDGKITAAGKRTDIKVPENSMLIDAAGLVLTAGYWNSHVHFTEEKWLHSDSIPTVQLNQQLEDMLTGYGFTHVFDIATFDIQNVLALRDRIESGEVVGPRIFTAGTPFTPTDGSPYYIAPLTLPEIGTAREAAAHVKQQIEEQADAIKIFAASPNGRQIVYMAVPVVKEAVAVAHRLGKPVFAHPTDNKGVSIAIEGGVDILAHSSPEDREVWSDEMIDRMLAADMALIPTLQLYKWDLELHGFSAENHPLLLTARQQLGAYAEAGGEILFGTDVGFVTEYSPAEEYRLMAEAGMSFSQILAALTTSPAARFGRSSRTGTIAVGMDADLVLLARDPIEDAKAFAEVVYTIRNGQIIYQSK